MLTLGPVQVATSTSLTAALNSDITFTPTQNRSLRMAQYFNSSFW